MTVACSQATTEAFPESPQIVDETRRDGVDEARRVLTQRRTATPLAEPHVEVDAALAAVGAVVVTDALTDTRTAVKAPARLRPTRPPQTER